MGNMFKCVLASGIGSGIPLIVTCTSAFAGLTITCTDGTTTLTDTCPSSSPYEITFNLPNTGTWTVSGTISGQTFTTTITVTDETALLSDIPDGATVTPTNDVQILLNCANIWDKSYTTISQLLADTTSLLAVISDNNAVDYLVRSTTFATDVCNDSTAMTYIGADDYCADTLLSDPTWLNAICNSTYFESVLNVKIPTMTSNTAPSGEAFASSIYSGTYAAYKAFDGNNQSPWLPSSGATNNSIGYRFPSAIKGKMALMISTEVGASRTFNIVGTNGDENHTLATVTISQANKSYYVPLNNDDSYTDYFAFCSEVLAWSGASHRVSTLQIYGRA